MLHDRLGTLINILGIKKGDFAERIGFSQSYISMILRQKKNNPSQRFFDSIASAFQVNLDWLQYGVGNMFLLPEAHMTPTDQDLLQKFKSLPRSEQRIILEKIDAMLIQNF